MTVQKDRQPIPIDPIEEMDPAVETALGKPPGRGSIYERMRRAKEMTPAQRRKAQRDKERNRVMLDLPPDLDDLLEMLSQEERVSKSQFASYLLLLGLSAFEKNNNFNWLKTPTRSMRFEFNVNLPAIPDVYITRLNEFRKNKG